MKIHWCYLLVLGFSVMACGQGPYCCAIEKASEAASNNGYNLGYDRVVDANDEDVCRTIVEGDLSTFREGLILCSD